MKYNLSIEIEVTPKDIADFCIRYELYKQPKLFDHNELVLKVIKNYLNLYKNISVNYYSNIDSISEDILKTFKNSEEYKKMLDFAP